MSDTPTTTEQPVPKVPKLALALKEFKNLNIAIVKGKKNDFYKSTYADLPSILEAVEPALLELNVSIRSVSYFDGNQWVLATIVEHIETKEFVQSVFPIFGVKPQEIGSAITYARRYNIQSILNLAAEDDDGNATRKSKPTPTKTAGKTVEADAVDYDKLLKGVKTQEQYDALHQEHREAIKSLPVDEKKAIIAKFHDKLDSITTK